MPTSNSPLYVWVWLPRATDPVVAGRLDRVEGTETVAFTYAESYLRNGSAISLYEPELPLRPGTFLPTGGKAIASCIRDAGPDAWGQRVIFARQRGHIGRDGDTGIIDVLTYLAESGSNRIGALDFQASSTEYVARTDTAMLEELHRAADILDQGGELSRELSEALLRGSSIGGARPKALIDSEGRQYVAKFSSSNDAYPVIKAEAVGMELARRAELDVPQSHLVTSLGKDVLLVERFDRVGDARRLMVSGLTMLDLDEMVARYATYPDLAEVLRRWSAHPADSQCELFTRIVFNVAIGNNDDHARNHAAFWDGRHLELTPAYDLCPQLRSGGETAQAMAIGSDGARLSQFAVCVDAAADYGLDRSRAIEIVDHIVETVHSNWDEAADFARLSRAERDVLFGSAILNPYASYGYNSGPSPRTSTTGRTKLPQSRRASGPRHSSGEFTRRENVESDVRLEPPDL
jgi:serine/threonine-protein kinase HipA